MIVAGPTMCGKSTWIKEMLLNIEGVISPIPGRIVWIYKRWQPLYDELKCRIPCITFIQGITEDIKSDTFIDPCDKTLLIIDDMMKDATQDREICEIFTEGAHHRNLSVICIMQNFSTKGKKSNDEFENSEHSSI